MRAGERGNRSSKHGKKCTVGVRENVCVQRVFYAAAGWDSRKISLRGTRP